MTGEAILPPWPAVSRRHLFAAGVLAVGVLLLPAPRRPALGGSSGVAFLQDLGDRAVAMLSDPALPESSRTENFRALMSESFNMPAIGRFILGRYWRQASDPQKAEFLETFQRVMAARFAPYFAGSSQDSFTIVGPVDGAGDNRQAVRSKIRLTDGQLAQVDWHLAKHDGGFRIVDVVTEGVSMGITLRSEYGSVLSRNSGDIEALIQLLQERTGA
jgi:phospholipid transport system substrate-binding protein